MGFFSNLFNKTKKEKVGGMEDYMTLVRVYFQAALASKLGISNLGMFPDLRTFKTTLKVPTVNNKLGVGEKSHCKKMMMSLYHTDEDFFKEIDASIKKNCRKIQDVQPYLFQFQGFTQSLMMLVSNLMKYKIRIPSIFKKTLYAATSQTVEDIFTKPDFKDPSVVKTAMETRTLNSRLGFSHKWVTDFIFQVILLAKKEPKPKDEDVKKEGK